jgi:hypothetical protein
MTDEKDDLDALKARVAELERAAKPPAPPDPGDYTPINPLDRLSMPVSTMREMAKAVPDAMMREIALKDHRVLTGPSGQGIVPSSQTLSNVRGTGRGTGWSEPRPLQNPSGVNYIDRLMDAQDAKDRHERVVQDAQRQALRKAAEEPK